MLLDCVQSDAVAMSSKCCCWAMFKVTLLNDLPVMQVADAMFMPIHANKVKY